MSTTNLGNQYITFDYRHPAKGNDFNTLLREALTPGLYTGGTITYAGNQVFIAPFVIYIKVSTDKLVRIETRNTVTLTITESTPVIALTYIWQDVSEDWLDFNQRASGSAPLTNEICLGECVFVGGVITSIDYTNKTWGRQTYNDVPNGTTPLIITSQTVVTNLNADMLDSAHKSTDATFAADSDLLIPTEKAIRGFVFPIGSFYVQYPNANNNTDTIAFPVSTRPATLFGGTWAEQWGNEGITFYTGYNGYDTEQTRVDGLQQDQAETHTHYVVAHSGYYYNIFGILGGGTACGIDAGYLYGLTGRNGSTTKGRNRLVKIWKRTA